MIKQLVCIFLLFCGGLIGNIRPVPWLTEGSISFLENFIDQNPGAKILEFGSGASTLWFSKRNVDLHSVEHHHGWYSKIKRILEKDPACQPVKYYFRARPYYTLCEEFPDEYFDLIIVDGRNRKGCIFHSLPKLKKGGVLMLDNAERQRYQSVLVHLDDWQRFDAYQEKPDQCGFTYPGWLTSWWVKP